MRIKDNIGSWKHESIQVLTTSTTIQIEHEHIIDNEIINHKHMLLLHGRRMLAIRYTTYAPPQSAHSEKQAAEEQCSHENKHSKKQAGPRRASRTNERRMRPRTDDIKQ